MKNIQKRWGGEKLISEVDLNSVALIWGEKMKVPVCFILSTLVSVSFGALRMEAYLDNGM